MPTLLQWSQPSFACYLGWFPRCAQTYFLSKPEGVGWGHLKMLNVQKCYLFAYYPTTNHILTCLIAEQYMSLNYFQFQRSRSCLLLYDNRVATTLEFGETETRLSLMYSVVRYSHTLPKCIISIILPLHLQEIRSNLSSPIITAVYMYIRWESKIIGSYMLHMSLNIFVVDWTGPTIV